MFAPYATADELRPSSSDTPPKARRSRRKPLSPRDAARLHELVMMMGARQAATLIRTGVEYQHGVRFRVKGIAGVVVARRMSPRESRSVRAVCAHGRELQAFVQRVRRAERPAWFVAAVEDERAEGQRQRLFAKISDLRTRLAAAEAML